MVNGTLPSGWEWTNIGTVADTTSGGTPSRKYPEYFEGTIPWVKSGELGDGLVSNTEEKITEIAIKNSSAKIFPAGIVLVALYGATVGKVGILNMDAASNQAVCALFPKNNLFLEKYMFFWLMSQRKDLINKSIGGAQPNISQGIVRSHPFPLAPIPEQERIVSRIEELFSDLEAGVAALERVRAGLKRYKASVLRAVFEGKLVKQNPLDKPVDKLIQRIDQEKLQLINSSNIAKPSLLPMIMDNEKPFDIPNKWTWVRLDSICSLIMDIAHKMPKAVEVGIKFISAKDLIDDGTINFDHDVKRISERDYQNLAKRIEPKRNDIIYSRIGARLGKARLVETDEKFMVSYSCCVIRPIGVNEKFLAYYLDSGVVLQQARTSAQSIGVPDLGMAKIKNFVIPLPPLDERRRIVAETERRLSVVGEVESAVEAGMVRAARLRQSVLRSAFEGRLK